MLLTVDIESMERDEGRNLSGGFLGVVLEALLDRE